MNTIRCCVIDDEPLAGRLIASYVERTLTLSLVGVYTSASDAVRDILDGKVDLVFLDIEMPQINGMEFAKIVPQTCRIIFTTAYNQYAAQGYKVNAVDYLLKPVSYDEFLQAANRAIASIQQQRQLQEAPKPEPQREFLIVKSEYKMIQVRINDILLIEGLKDYIKIYVQGQSKAILTLMSMKSVESVLPASKFMRVHRSYIVNKEKISIIERNHLYIADHMVPVSESYRDQFAAYISSLNPED